MSVILDFGFWIQVSFQCSVFSFQLAAGDGREEGEDRTLLQTITVIRKERR